MSAIAIVGMGCRFAGAEDLQSYWQMTLEGRDAFGPVPEDRWPAEVFFDTNRRATDKTYAPHGAFIQDIRSFPALSLGLPPRRVEVMDPQQRLALELSLHAIEDAGYRPPELPDRTGVYMGVTATEYRSLTSLRVAAVMLASGVTGESPDDPTAMARAVDRLVPSRPYSAPGVLGNMCAAAVAQELDLKGPAYTTDAACASAHMAVYDAVQQLRAGNVDAALAGGVYIQITPDHYIAFARIGAMSPSGYCRPFDHRADGFVQGDGGGVILLKRLADAQRDNDRIYGVIHGAAINNDGRGDGPMAPLSPGQTDVIRRAWHDAGLDPHTLGYVETHGTGTSVGDPTEIRGLRDALPADAQPIAIGSSKANVGHTMSAAGIAGLIRSVLAVHHGVIPPMAGFEQPHPKLDLGDGAIHIPTRSEPWSTPQRVAGCSAFGFGGTNGHIIVANPPDAPSPSLPHPAPPQPELVLLSAGSESDLRDLAGRTASALRDQPRATVAGVSRAWANRRRQPWRLGVVATSIDQLIDQLQAVAAGESAGGVTLAQAPEEPARLAFLYPGQGAQRTGMLRDAKARFPQIAARIEALEAELLDDLPRPLTHLIYPELRAEPIDAEAAEAELTETSCCQPAMLAAGLALTDVLATVGIQPHVVTGHSLGEFVAAAAAGVLGAGEAARFVAARGRLMSALPGDHGAMAAIMADRQTAESLLVPGAVVANVNHPRQVVVSGLSPAVDQVVQNATQAEIKAVRLQVSHGFHGPALEGLDSRPLVDRVRFSDPQITVASGIDSTPYASAEQARAVFLRHATSPVDFVGALEQCRAAGANLYLQVGAGGPLASFARGSLPRDHRGVLTLAGRDDADGGASLLDTLAQLWVRGVDLDPRPITAPASLPSLPPTVLPREPYWAIKEEPQLALEIRGAAPRAPRKQAVAEPAAAPQAVQEQPERDTLEERVIAVIAKVSAYPVTSLRRDMALVEDLGFDSLMVGDLASGLSEAFEAIDGIPQELLINRPTVNDIIEFARNAGTGAGSNTHRDTDPLTAYGVGWLRADAPTLPQRELAEGLTALAIGLPQAAIARLRAAGIAVTTCTAEQAATAERHQLVVWGALEPGPDLEVAGLDAPVPDPAAALLGALANQASQGAHPNLIVVVRDGDPWAGGPAGVARSLPSEWPGAVATTLHLDDDALGELGPLLLQTLTSADRTPDLRYAQGARFVPSLAPTPAPTVELPEGERVLITGGTRGIGLKLAEELLGRGAQVLLVGRSEPGPEANALLQAHPGRAVAISADVTDREGLTLAVEPHRPIAAIVHAAGVLADGPLESVDPARGALARAVKVDGLLHAVHAAGSALRSVVALGSWAGRFGNRHQAHYAAANAAMASLVSALPSVRGVTLEFGPWTSSEMVQTIPAPVQAAMRAEGVDFVADEVGLEAILRGLVGGSGAMVLGRDLPPSLQAAEVELTLSTQTDPYLLDHAIEGTPVLPLAGASDLMAWVGGASAPFSLSRVRLFQGVTVTEPVQITLTAKGDKVELRQGARRSLAYQARLRPLQEPTADPGISKGGEPPTLSLETFYQDITFHGPKLQGITRIDAVGEGFVRGAVRVGEPADWSPQTSRDRFTIDPLALDSAMQLSAYVAWIRYQRAGTPVGLGRYEQLAPFPKGQELHAEVTFGPIDGDRFTGTLWLRDPDSGALLAVAHDVIAELRQSERTESDEPRADEAPFEPKPEWTTPSAWPEVKELENRLAMAQMAGIRNPYFRVQQGTARDTTVIEGREYINFSSYNYIGLSGDPRVLAAVREAVDRYGTSVSASRVASGERPFHQDLERGLARAQRAEDSLVFTAGHATNVTTIGHLFGKDDLIIHDEYIHDSGLQGIKLSGAARRAFKHDDPESCETELRRLRRHYKRCLILVEGVYSMDGDICALPQYVALKRKYGALLMVDEAHSFGIIGATGQGASEHFDLAPDDVDIWMGTLSKSLASCGGWIAGSASLVNYLRYTAPGFVYSAGLTAANGVAALESLKLMLEEPWRVTQLQNNARFFQRALVDRGIDTGPAHGESGVVPAITGNSMWALQLAQRLNEAGINVQPIVYPAVPDDAARLRYFLSSTHSEDQLLHTAELTAQILNQVKAEFPLPK
ncbi:MAG: aminotransferase class I/II-fold pyridoxal phosphate-dependent enzyme [Deltaproteobacteria bacterium]|nr:MAG: aminotransferase class I/II-fold pyridoxal phosphate-dependent enzyme [Deltaproteobacteria bacterium]